MLYFYCSLIKRTDIILKPHTELSGRSLRGKAAANINLHKFRKTTPQCHFTVVLMLPIPEEHEEQKKK